MKPLAAISDIASPSSGTFFPRLGRRDFLGWSGLGTLALLAGTAGCAHSPTRPVRHRVAFNTANLVARVSNYRFELSRWSEQHQKTIAATDEAAWRRLCQEIAACGFKAVEIWEAHAAPESLDAQKARTWKRVLDDCGLQPIAYAGRVRRETLVGGRTGRPEPVRHCGKQPTLDRAAAGLSRRPAMFSPDTTRLPKS